MLLVCTALLRRVPEVSGQLEHQLRLREDRRAAD